MVQKDVAAPRRIPPWVVFGAVLAPVAALRLTKVIPAGAPSETTVAVGAALGALGVILSVWSVLALLRFDGTGPVVSGPFRFSRHPMYLGMFLILGAAAVWAAEWALVAVIPVLALGVDRFVARPEEAELAAAFPEAWAAYVRSVRRWL